MKPLALIASLMIGVVAHAAPCAAYTLSPISRVFAPSGSESTQFFEVANGGAQRIALTVSVSTLERDLDYVETNHDAEDDFLVYPSQMIVPAGGKQIIRVTWLGTATPSQELAFRIKVQEIPVESLDRTAPAAPVAKVRVMLTYNGTLLIRPPRAAPNIAPDIAGLAQDSSGNPALAITLSNAGTAVGQVRSCTLRLVSADRTAIELSGAALATLVNTRVLAGSRRRFLVPWPAALRPGPVKVMGQCGVTP